MQRIFDDKSPIEAAKKVAEMGYIWPGGYALGIFTKDGGILCHQCVKENLKLVTSEDCDPQWNAECVFYTDTDDEQCFCDHCYNSICR